MAIVAPEVSPPLFALTEGDADAEAAAADAELAEAAAASADEEAAAALFDVGVYDGDAVEVTTTTLGGPCPPVVAGVSVTTETITEGVCDEGG